MKNNQKKDKTEREIEIDGWRKRRRESLSKGILKLSAPALSLLIGLGSLGMTIGAAYQYHARKNAESTFYNDASFVQMQAEDLTKANEKLSSGEIDEAQYNQEVEYIRSRSYLKNAMKDNQEFQALLKLEKAYKIMGIVGGVLASSLLYLTLALCAKFDHDASYYIEDGINAGDEIRRLKKLPEKEYSDSKNFYKDDDWHYFDDNLLDNENENEDDEKDFESHDYRCHFVDDDTDVVGHYDDNGNWVE